MITRRYFIKAAPVAVAGAVAISLVPLDDSEPTGVRGEMDRSTSTMNRWKVFSEPHGDHVGYMTEFVDEVKNGEKTTTTYDYVFANLRGSNYPLKLTNYQIQPYML